ncbi:MAG: hypothetical protein A2W00_00805 [Candidatus Eisenbacteria bacterium RBG_16_71_46]|nr:MAG: hypothetical protein A2W00_00805 [Candidatus Eisenbacteria bacterium RBG_16_71_46]
MELRRRVEELLGPGGAVASRWPRYERRDGQRALAAEIALCLEHGGLLLAEAPTGVGKSLAYLLPSVLLALESEQRVVIATCTRSLQDQLFERDLPALLEVLGVRLAVARLKGKQNYVCPRALELQQGEGPEEDEVLETVRAWAAADPEGDLDRFPAADPEAFRRVRGRIAADPAACTLATCRRGRECAWVRARRVAAQARLLIVNHALLAISSGVEGLLPDFDVLVVDEAHRLEGVLLGQLERTVSRHRIEELLRLVGSPRERGRRGYGHGGALLARLRGYAAPLISGGGPPGATEAIERLARRVGEARQDLERLFVALEPRGARHEIYGARDRYRSAGDLLGGDFEALEAVLGHCAEFARGLQRLGLGLDGAGEAGGELAAELEQVAGRFAGVGADLQGLTDPAERDWVYWRTAGGRGVELHGLPITVGGHTRRMVLSRARAAVLTSATLSSAGDFSFIAGRLGLGEQHGVPYATCSTPSPFPLARQMRAYVHDGGRDEAAAVAEVVVALAAATGRNQLVLFTAHERLRRARARLLDVLPAGRLVLAQEWDGPAGIVSERFRASRGAILLGVQSLWEGVDFPGESLEILVVAKLPFSVPDDPLVEARGERLREAGSDPFHDDAVPEAVLRFRQGVGRLIRRGDDRGVLVVCDPRLLAASYRRPFLDSLPVPPRRVGSAADLAAEAARFLAGSEPVEDR